MCNAWPEQFSCGNPLLFKCGLSCLLCSKCRLRSLVINHAPAKNYQAIRHLVLPQHRAGPEADLPSCPACQWCCSR